MKLVKTSSVLLKMSKISLNILRAKYLTAEAVAVLDGRTLEL